MTVSITHNFTLVDAADSITGWTAGLALYSGFQREGNGCLGEQASNGSVNVFHTITADDLSDSTIFGPWLRSGNPTTQANGGFRTIAGDGINTAIYYTGGSDYYGFFFNGYSLFKLDLAQKAAYTNETLAGGGDASLNEAAITQIGGGWDYGSKAVGNSDNVFLDVVRYITNGDPALVIGGGGSTTEGNFAEVVAEDESTTNAWGVIRQAVPGSKSYELNFGVDIGDSGTGSSYFDDANFQLFLSGENMSAGNMDVNLLANATGTNLLKLDNFVVVGVGTVSNWDLSTANSDTMEMTNGQFVSMGNFAFPVSGGTSRLTRSTAFIQCGTIDAGGIPFTDATFLTCGAVTHGGGDMSGSRVLLSAVAADASALIYDVNADPDGEMDGMSFTKGTNAHHAIGFGTNSPIEMSLRDIDFSGFNAANAQNDSTFYIARTVGTVTLNLFGCSGNVTYKSAGATVVINRPVTLSMTVKDSAGVEVADAYAYIDDNNITPFIMNTQTNASGVASVNHNDGPVVGATWRVRKYGYRPYVTTADIGLVDINIPVTLITDPQQT